MCACSPASIFLFASSKLLPRTVTASSSQTPFQESCSSQKLQSFGTPAITLSFTGWAIADPPILVLSAHHTASGKPLHSAI